MAGILDSLYSYFGMVPPNAVRAVTRVTRTPIKFTDKLSDSKDYGEYDPQTKTISINPNAPSDLGTMIRHESIHALMDQVPGSGQMAAQSAGYPDIAKQMAGVGGDPTHESVAYMGSYPTSQILGISDRLREAFLDDFGTKLAAAAPDKASTWNRLRK